MKIMSVYSMKGGVGKTATAVNLAYLSSLSGVRTLLWDLDPQAASTFYFNLKPKVRKINKFMKGEVDLDQVIKSTDYEYLDLLPADFSYRKMEQIFDQQKKPAAQLLKMLRPLSKRYDLVILDCPPNISLLSDNIFKASDTILVPVIPTTLSARTLTQLLDYLHREDINVPVTAFYSMVDRRKRLHKEMIETNIDNRCKTLEASIPYASDVERMGIKQRPVCDYSPNSAASISYKKLWMQLQRKRSKLRK